MISSCPCQNCGVELEFDITEAMQFVDCPHCHQPTRYILPARKLPQGIPLNRSGIGARRKHFHIPAPIWIVGLVAILLTLLAAATSDASAETLGTGIGIIVGLCIYFIPAALAMQNKHKNSDAIFVLNLVAGWTFVGWVIALVWAVKKD